MSTVSPLSTYCSLLNEHCLPQSTYCSLLNEHSLPQSTYSSLLNEHCLPQSTYCSLLNEHCLSQSTYCGLLNEHCCLGGTDPQCADLTQQAVCSQCHHNFTSWNSFRCARSSGLFVLHFLLTRTLGGLSVFFFL